MRAQVQRVGDRVAVVIPDEPLSLDDARALALEIRTVCDGQRPDRSVATFCEIHRGQFDADWVPASTLLTTYRRWCARTKRQPVTAPRFWRAARALLPYRRDNRRRRYRL